jgi:hypothetical protein
MTDPSDAPGILQMPLGDGSSLLVSGYNEGDALSSVEQQLRKTTMTPTPSGDGGGRGGGAITRATDAFTVFGVQGIRTLGLSSHEIGDGIRTRRDELYRNEFPNLKPRFAKKCEECGTELQESPGNDVCPACGNETLRGPDPEEKREAEELFENVNREGQSLRELAKYCEPDQWTAGVSTIVIQYEYHIARNSAFFEDGEVISKEPEELVYGDPATIKPVVDENRRIGGVWWACPLHRDDVVDCDNHEGGHRRCEECGAELQEVFFVEERGRDDDQAYYFRDEIVTWAYPMPRLSDLDGLSPLSGVMLRQIILEMMHRYGAAFFDPDADRLPNQLMILHTTNPDQWQNEMERIREEDDPYDSPILTNQFSPNNASTPEVQVVDAMPDDLLGQSDAIKQDYKEDIRQAVGISNIHDSDLSDAGGLNNEGLQLEVTDRSIASQQHDYVEGWLDTLAKRLGIDDWYIDFLPAYEDRDALDLQREVQAGVAADQGGLNARWEDGRVTIEDGEFDAPAEGPAPSDDGDDSPAAPDTRDGGTQAADRYGPDPDATAAEQAADVLGEAFEHLVWDDPTEQQAQPFWGAAEDVPANVQRHIESAVARTDWTMADQISASTLQPFFREKLTQPQGWSIDSLADDLADQADVEEDYAQTVARSGAARVLTKAKAEAFRELEERAGQEALYYWRGPDDSDTSEGCAQLKDLTNPDHGGTPRPLEEFHDLQREVHDEYFEGLAFDEAALHPQERHTIEATVASAVN